MTKKEGSTSTVDAQRFSAIVDLHLGEMVLAAVCRLPTIAKALCPDAIIFATHTASRCLAKTVAFAAHKALGQRIMSKDADSTKSDDKPSQPPIHPFFLAFKKQTNAQVKPHAVGGTKRSHGESPASASGPTTPQADAKRRKTTVSTPPAPDDVLVAEDNDVEAASQVRRQTTYAELCTMFEAVEATTKRLIITGEVRRFLVRVLCSGLETDFLSCVYLCINRLGPDYEGLELGIGEGLIVKAIAESTGRTTAKIKESLANVGDLGKVAQSSREAQKTMFQPRPLTVESVFKVLKEIAKLKGGDVRKQNS